MFKRSFYLVLLVSMVASLLAFTPARPAYAAGTLIVNTLTDENDGSCVDGDCSLRDAIQVANPGDTITFSVTGTIILTIDQLSISKNLTITGPGAGQLTVSGNDAHRVFYINSGYIVSISDLTISDGYVQDNHGAGVNNFGTLTLNRVVVKDNLLVSVASDYLRGGGIHSYDNSTLMVYDSTISGNTATQLGGGIFVGFNTATTLDNVIVDNNHVTCTACGTGGGLAFRGQATLTNVTVTNNTATYSGGGIYSDSPLTISSSLIANNSTVRYGGG